VNAFTKATEADKNFIGRSWLQEAAHPRYLRNERAHKAVNTTNAATVPAYWRLRHQTGKLSVTHIKTA